MSLLNFLKKEYTVGLDIGSSSVKVAQFAAKEGALRLVKADMKEIAHAGDDAAREKETVSAIKILLRGVDLKRSTIIANVNCSQTAIKRVTAPYIPKSELRHGIELQAKNYFPFPIDKSLLDFEIAGDTVEKGVRKYELVVAACPIRTVDRYLALLKNAGIKPSAFVSSSYALQKIVELGSDKNTNNAICYVDIGENHTELVILKSRYLVFSRKIPITGNDFTRSMTGMLISDRGKTQLSLEEAEKIKRDIGLPSETDTKIIDGKIAASQVLAMLRSPAEQLVSEIERCFDYYREESGGGNIDSVVLFGGGASLGGLLKFLSDGLGVGVRLGDPMEGLKIDGTAVSDRGRLAHRVELAIGAALSNPKGMNLLPAEIKEETKIVIRRGTVEGIVTAVILISVLIFMGMRIKLDNLNKRIDVARRELTSIEPLAKKAEAQVLANKVLVDEPQWEDVFTELSNLVPETVEIDKLTMSNDIITIKGTVSSPDGEQILAGFVLTLERGLFKNVKLISSNDLGEKPGVAFELRCWLDYT